MALFENFPYTNLHDLNLDWVLATIRKLIAEWTAYKLAMDEAFDDLKGQFHELYDYVMNYFENLDLDDAVTAAVREVLQEMIEDGTINELIAEYIKNIGGGGKTTVNLLAEYLTDTLQNSDNWFSSTNYEFAPQGFCYIGNNRCVLYTRTKPESESKGVLVCIDLSTGTILWKSDRIKCYHGNTIAYDGTYLYLSGAVDDSTGTSYAQHKVYRIDPQYPSSIDKEYTIPGQNIAIDDVTGKFYVGGGQLGNNPNKLWIYDDEAALSAATEADTPDVTLQSTDLTQYAFNHARTQGIAVHNGTLYQLFDMEMSACLAFNAETGQYIRGWNIPYIWNGCKYSQELEDLSYDPVNDRWLIMTITPTQRTHNCQVANIGEIGLYKNVVERLPRYAVYEGAQTASVDLQVENDAAQVLETGACLPFFDRHPTSGNTLIANKCIFYNAYDAELFGEMRGQYSYIHYVATARHTGRPVFSNWHPHTSYRLTAAEDCLLRITVPDFKRVETAFISGAGSAGNVNLYNSTSGGAVIDIIDNSRVTLQNVELEPSSDSVVRGIDLYRDGHMCLQGAVKMASGYEALPLYRVRTNGVIENAQQLYDGAIVANTTTNLDLPAYSTGLISIQLLPEDEPFHPMVVVDRSNGNLFKVAFPVNAGTLVCNMTIQQNDIRFNKIVLYEHGESTGTEQAGLDRIIVHQSPNYPEFTPT